MDPMLHAGLQDLAGEQAAHMLKEANRKLKPVGLRKELTALGFRGMGLGSAVFWI